jgi:hypothetical protein
MARPAHTLTTALLTALVCGALGCGFFLHDMMGVPDGKADNKNYIKFSHEFHINLLMPKEAREKARKPEAKTDEGRKELMPAWEKSCNTCHKAIKNESEYTFPGHIECGSCHAREVTSDCLYCHNTRPQGNPKFVREGTPDLIFNHGQHTNNPDKKLALYCANCHVTVPFSNSPKDKNLPSMWDCRDCHGGVHSREADGAKWTCDTCHEQFVEGVQPRSHLASRPQLPASHDVTFRTTHGTLAKMTDNGCDRCHDDVSCDRCHMTELPRDHTPRFAKSTHGREATNNRDRCATCHEAGFCAGCHSIEPSSHFQPNFQAEGHAFLARRDMRACFACHQFADTCVECHSAQSVNAVQR